MNHLAFFGLGFDFTKVEERAAGLIFKLLKSREDFSFYPDYYPPSGIELLIFLNRETGGS